MRKDEYFMHKAIEIAQQARQRETNLLAQFWLRMKKSS